MKQKGQLTPSHWSRLEKALRALYSPGLSTENFVQRTLAAVKTLIPGEFATYSHAIRDAEDGGDVFLSVQRQGGPDFTEAERALLGLLQPHLRNARTLAHDRAATGDFQVEDFSGIGLTPREMEVFYWVVEGKRNAEIAAILKLRVDTVKGHVERIFQKLHVENRHTAIRLGLERVQLTRRDEWKPHREDPRAYFLKRKQRPANPAPKR